MPAHSSHVPPDTVAPRFTLPSASGGEVSLADYRGQFYVVLVFLRGSR